MGGLISFLFGNDYWLEKIIIVIIISAVLCIYSEEEIFKKYPDFVNCLASPQRYHGAELHVLFAEVVQVKGDGFLVEKKEFSIWINSSVSVTSGEYVSVKGKFDKEKFILASGVIKHGDYELKRSIMYIGSVIAVAVFILEFLRARGFCIFERR